MLACPCCFARVLSALSELLPYCAARRLFSAMSVGMPRSFAASLRMILFCVVLNL